jgi:DNA-binding TFAR19-related protein (PDSD5 family)
MASLLTYTLLADENTVAILDPTGRIVTILDESDLIELLAAIREAS